MVSSAGFAQSSALASYAKTTDLSPYAKTSDLSPYAQTSALSVYAKTTDLSAYALSSTVTTLSNTVDTNYLWWYATYQYNRCVLNLGQYLTYPTMSDMLFCWTNWVGTDIGVSKAGSKSATAGQSENKSEVDSAGKLQAETDRIAELKKGQ